VTQPTLVRIATRLSVAKTNLIESYYAVMLRATPMPSANSSAGIATGCGQLPSERLAILKKPLTHSRTPWSQHSGVREVSVAIRR